jgi:hypothetical protein
MEGLVEVGQSKEEIQLELGSPDEINTYLKASEHIWGPDESFWSEIPMGTTIEVWRYQGESGQLNLYFLRDRSSLSYKAFAPTGVVYESSE